MLSGFNELILSTKLNPPTIGIFTVHCCIDMFDYITLDKKNKAMSTLKFCKPSIVQNH